MASDEHPLPTAGAAATETEPPQDLTDDPEDQHRSWIRCQLAPLVIAVVAAVLVAGVIMADGSNVRALPVNGSPEAGFARDMSAHHLQAVEMAEPVRGRTDDDNVRLLAFDIATTQLTQIGRMQGWLDVWGLSSHSAGPPMSWMSGHTISGSGGEAMMPGVATDQELSELRQAEGPEADRLFLQFMIAHHRGGVAMANAVLDQRPQAEVRQLAEAIVTSQQAEIDAMQQLLQIRPSDPGA